MQQTSDLYKSLFNDLLAGKPGVRYESSLTIGSSDPDNGYDESVLISVKTTQRMFSGDTPSIGDCVAGEIDVSMLQPAETIPRRARLIPYVRLTDGVNRSEWIQQGVYFIDTRKSSGNDIVKKLTIHGYDAMLRAEADYPPSNMQWPARDIDVVQEIAGFMGVQIDSRTVDIMTNGYQIPYTTGYSCREILGYIAAMYAGCFVMSDVGALRLIALNGIPKETRYLIAAAGEPITFGGVRILV